MSKKKREKSAEQYTPTRETFFAGQWDYAQATAKLLDHLFQRYRKTKETEPEKVTFSMLHDVALGMALADSDDLPEMKNQRLLDLLCSIHEENRLVRDQTGECKPGCNVFWENNNGGCCWTWQRCPKIDRWNDMIEEMKDE